MAGITTDVILIGNHSVGPFGVREWRVRNAIALIAKHHRVWMPTGMAHGIPDPEPLGPIIVPRGLTPAEELVLLIAATAVKAPAVLEALTEAGFTRPCPFPGEPPMVLFDDHAIDNATINPELVDLALRELVDVVRLGRVRLHPQSALDEPAVLWLRSVGLDVEEFRSMPLGGDAS